MDFSIVATATAADSWTLRLGGVIERIAARRLESALDRACDADAREIVLDMAGVSFVDGPGLRAILRGQMVCQSRGCTLMLGPVVQPVVRRLFELAEVWETMPMAPLQPTPGMP
jgi:anti-anti-sigma factor